MTFRFLVMKFLRSLRLIASDIDKLIRKAVLNVVITGDRASRLLRAQRAYYLRGHRPLPRWLVNCIDHNELFFGASPEQTEKHSILVIQSVSETYPNNNSTIFAGKAGELIDRNDNTYGGKWVINPSGGLISKGHPIGATGMPLYYYYSLPQTIST